MTGTVVWFRGSFGFISPDGGGADVFCHWTGIDGPKSQHKALEGGQRVEFTVDTCIETNREVAVNVKPLKED